MLPENPIRKEAVMSKKHKKRRWAKSHLLKIYVFYCWSIFSAVGAYFAIVRAGCSM